jgi:hypothetical protein
MTNVRRGTIKDIILRKDVRWIKTEIKNKRVSAFSKTLNQKFNLLIINNYVFFGQ